MNCHSINKYLKKRVSQKRNPHLKNHFRIQNWKKKKRFSTLKKKKKRFWKDFENQGPAQGGSSAALIRHSSHKRRDEEADVTVKDGGNCVSTLADRWGPERICVIPNERCARLNLGDYWLLVGRGSAQWSSARSSERSELRLSLQASDCTGKEK